MAGYHIYFDWPNFALSILGATIAYFVQRRIAADQRVFADIVSTVSRRNRLHNSVHR